MVRKENHTVMFSRPYTENEKPKLQYLNSNLLEIQLMGSCPMKCRMRSVYWKSFVGAKTYQVKQSKVKQVKVRWSTHMGLGFKQISQVDPDGLWGGIIEMRLAKCSTISTELILLSVISSINVTFILQSLCVFLLHYTHIYIFNILYIYICISLMYFSWECFMLLLFPF